MKRTQARESIFILVFESSFNTDSSLEEIYKLAIDTEVIEDDEYIYSTFCGCVEKDDELNQKISGSAVGWKTQRMSKISLAIMKVALYEMLYVDDVPFAVAINEALELAKKYDHDSAPSFINGILNNIAEKEGLKN